MPSLPYPDGTLALTVYVSRWSNCDRSLEPCPGAPFAMHHTSWCSHTDGCYTRRVLLRQNQCVRTTTSVPLAQKARPQLASWARASDCLPLGSPHGRAGTAGLVPDGLPCLWCCHLSWVCLCPSACWKCPPAHLSPCFLERPPGLQHSPCPSILKHWFFHPLLLSPLSWDRFGVSQWKDCRAQALAKGPSSSSRPVPRVLPQRPGWS